MVIFITFLKSVISIVLLLHIFIYKKPSKARSFYVIYYIDIKFSRAYKNISTYSGRRAGREKRGIEQDLPSSPTGTPSCSALDSLTLQIDNLQYTEIPHDNMLYQRHRYSSSNVLHKLLPRYT